MRAPPSRLRSGAVARLDLAETGGAFTFRSAMGAGNQCSLLAGKKTAHELEIFGSIDLDRYGVNDRHIDAHAVFERAQLLELLALFQR